MNVLCLGCSWTDGVIEQPYNWVTSLSEMMPEHTFYNCSQRGSSLLYSIWVMEEFLSKAKIAGTYIKIDKIIFQITGEGRITYCYNYDNFDISQCIIAKSNNLFKLNIDRQNLATINYGSLLSIKRHHTKWEDIHSFAIEYYSKLNKQMHFDLEHRALVEYIRPKVDLMFTHIHSDIGIPGVTSIQDILGDQLFNDYCIDPGFHFNTAGVNWQAQHIRNLLF